MSLNPLPSPETMADACAASLRSAILGGDLPVGSLLPPERRLAAELGVHRATLRQALRELASQGLLEVRQGRGHRVCDFRSAGGPELLPGLAELAEEAGDLPTVVGDLLLVRRHLAAAVLGRLAKLRPDPGPFIVEVGRFEAAVTRGEGPAGLARADMAVLAALLALTGSPVLQLCLNPVSEVVHRLVPLQRAMFRAPMENLAGWQALAGWLADPVEAALPAVLQLLEVRDVETLRVLERSDL